MAEMEIKKNEDSTPVEAERLSPAAAITPDADIYEHDDSLTVVVDMPGCDQKSVDIRVERSVLTIEGNVEAEAEKDGHLDFTEYTPSNYRRRFTLSDEVDVDGIEANMKDGVLRIVLPKAKEDQTKKIEVEEK